MKTSNPINNSTVSQADASFLIPVYNGEEFLCETLDSCLQQTVMPRAIVVIDDASTDGTVSIIRRYANTYPNLVIPVFRKENGGRAIARNEGLSRIDTKYCLFVDADDVSNPNRVERQVAFMEENPDVAVSSSFIQYINASGRVFSSGTLDVLTRDQYLSRMANNELIGLFTSATIARTFLFRDEKYCFRPEFTQGQDLDLWNRISEKHIILAQPEYLVRYRIHEQSITSRKPFRSSFYREYIQDCVHRRRSGLVERSLNDFSAEWDAQPLWRKFNRWRMIRSIAAFRAAGLHLANHHWIRFASSFLFSAVLKPSYAFRRALQKMVFMRQRR